MSERKNSLAAQRIQRVLDDNSFVELGAGITARNTDFNLSQENTPSDGVITGHGLIDGNLVFIYSQDNSVLGGTIGEMHARKIANIYRMAVKMGAPVIGFLDCGGVRLQESFDALESIGSIYQEAVKASGVVPEITVVCGKCGGGMSVLTGVSDFVFMTNEAKLFVNAPDTIPGNSVDDCDTASAKFQYESTGLVDAIGSEDEIADAVRELVTILPGSNLEDGRFDEVNDDLNRASEIEGNVEDVLFVAKELSDNKLFVETKKGYATEMVTGFIKLDGQTVGLLGNQKTSLTAKGCRKAADFVRYCDAYEIPVLTLTNVKGYEASVHAEKTLPKALASFVFALSEASVPKINLITKNAFGTAYVLMNSKATGADLVLSLPDADMGIMDASLAAKLMYAGDDSADLNEAANLFEEKQSGINNALRHGYIDRVVNPADARKYLIAGFEMLCTKQVDEAFKKHGTK